MTTDPQLGTGLYGLTRKPVPHRVAYVQVVLFIAIGVGVLLLGIRRYDAVQPIAGGQTTSGTVVTVRTGQNCGHHHGCSTYWVPTIEFTANGSDYAFAGPEASSSINIGDQVQVSYDPRNPAAARDLSAGVASAWMMLGIGALAILIGAASFISGFRRLHVRLNLTSAREGSGWVGHSGLHSVRGISVGVVVAVAIVILPFVIH